MNRRTAMTTVALYALLATFSLAEAAERPNILWVTSEDNGPHLGCYGDEFADTPNIDGIARKGMIYLNAWSTAPVCAPARTTLISGLYPPSTGAEHMRSMTRLPDGMKMYPQILREAGYFTSNRSKEDFNLAKTGTIWDAGGRKGHWRGRKPGQPFFSIFNIGTSHESQIRRRPHKAVHDPAKVRVPAYHPDHPAVRQDWAQYYDKITEMDGQVGGILKELEEDGLADSTIIFYYGDHGSGMPRSKRWPFNSGLRVPMIVHMPAKFAHLAPQGYRAGGKSDRLVGFIDLAPTVLSIAGIKPPATMQGHAFCGQHAAPEQPFGYGFRGRMDERYDMVRVVRDKRFIYLRHYMPHKIYGQHVGYMFQTPTTRIWKELYDAGKLQPPKTYFWERKPAEELFDLDADPDEVNNLATSSAPEHRAALERLRKAHREWVFRVRDVGFLPEGEIHSRSEGSTPYEVGHDPKQYPLEKVWAAADLASSLRPDAVDELRGLMKDEDSAVRYWGALGLLMRGTGAVKKAHADLTKALGDESTYVRVVAAQALAEYGDAKDLDKVLPLLGDLASTDRYDVFTAMAALTVIDELDDKASSLTDLVRKLPKKPKKAPGRTGGYAGRLIDKILTDARGPRKRRF